MTARDLSLLDLFRIDAESQVDALGTGLRALRRHAHAAERIESCLCAANALQDAAAMAGLAAGARLAGALRECFVAAKRGRIVLRRPSVDVLERGTDMLGRIARSGDPPASETEAMVAALQGLRDGQAVATPAADRVEEPPAPVPILELFQHEAESQLAKLAGGLADLVRDQGDTVALEICRRAAHSLIGACRSVGLGAGLILAHALEASFVATQQGRIGLGPATLDLLARGGQLLGCVARTPEAELPQWLGEKRAEVKAFLAELERVRGDEEKVTTAERIDGAAAAPEPPPEAAETDALLEMFLAETAALTETLRGDLERLHRDPDAPALLESGMRAAHSYKGAARIVGLTMGVTLARAVEECFVAAQRGRIDLGPAALEVLRRAVDLLDFLARMPPADFGHWGDDKRPDVEGLLAALRAVRDSPLDAGPPPAALPATPPQLSIGLGSADRMVLLELFYDEAEHLSRALTAGLLALEGNATGAEALDTCMTAANSLKDAARTVGVAVGMNLARAIEECVAATQQGRIALTQSSIDLLLRAADLLGFIGRTRQADFDQWGADKNAEAEALLVQLRRVRDDATAGAAPAQETPFERTFMGAGGRR